MSGEPVSTIVDLIRTTSARFSAPSARFAQPVGASSRAISDSLANLRYSSISKQEDSSEGLDYTLLLSPRADPTAVLSTSTSFPAAAT
jgi:hypothetical protein